MEIQLEIVQFLQGVVIVMEDCLFCKYPKCQLALNGSAALFASFVISSNVMSHLHCHLKFQNSEMAM